MPLSYRNIITKYRSVFGTYLEIINLPFCMYDLATEEVVFGECKKGKTLFEKKIKEIKFSDLEYDKDTFKVDIDKFSCYLIKYILLDEKPSLAIILLVEDLEVKDPKEIVAYRERLNDLGNILENILITEFNNVEYIEKTKETKYRLDLMTQAFKNSVLTTFFIAKNGEVLFANTEACNLLGYTEEEIKNLKLYDINPWYDEYSWPIHWELCKKAGVKTIDSNLTSKEGENIPVQAKIKHFEYKGEEYHITFCFDLREQIKLEKQLIEHNKLLEYNLEQLKQKENELKNAQAVLEASFSQTQAGIILVDYFEETNEVKAKFCNEEALKILGISKNEVSSLTSINENYSYTAYDLEGNILAVYEYPIVRSILKNEKVKNAEHIIVNNKGESYNIISNASPIYDSEGKVIAGINVFIDITSQKKLENQLLERNSQLEDNLNQLKIKENELAKAQAILEAAITQSPLAIIIADYFKETNTIQVRFHNSEANRIFGSDYEKAIDLNISQDKYSWKMFDHEGHQLLPRDYPIVKAILDDEVVKSQENKVINKNGETYWVLTNASPVYDSEGSVIAGMIVFSDITEQKEAQKQLEESEEKYSLLFNGMSDAYAYFEAIYDENNNIIDYVFIDVNPAYEYLTGISRNEIVGTTLKNNEIIKKTLEEDPTYWIDAYIEVEKTKEPKYLIKSYPGFLKKVFKVNVFSPKEGTIVGIFGDITEQVKAQKQLEESEEKYSLLFNGMSDAFAYLEAIYDSSDNVIDFKFLDINPAYEKITGLKKSEMIGTNLYKNQILEKVTEEDSIYWLDLFKEVEKTGKPVRMIRSYSGFINKDFKCSVFSPKKGFVALLAGDITEQIQTQQKLEKNEERLSLLFKGMTDGYAYFEAIYDSDNNVLDFEFKEINPAYEYLTGITRNEIVGTTLRKNEILEKVLEEKSIYWLELFKNIEKTGNPVRMIKSYPGYLQKEFKVYTFTPKKGTIVLIFGDITEQIRAQRELEKSEERLSLLFKGMTDGYAYFEAIYDSDNNVLDFEFKEINPAYEYLTGITRNEIVGTTLRKNEILEKVLEEKSIYWLELFKNIEKTGNPVRMIKSYPGYLQKEFKVYTFTPKKGTIVLIFGDITEQIRAQRELEKSEERLSLLFKGMTDGYAYLEAIYDSDNNIIDYEFVDINPAYEFLLGNSRSETVGKTLKTNKLLEQTLEEDLTFWLDLFKDIEKTKNRKYFNKSYSGNLNKEFEVNVFSPKPGAVVVIFGDITERVKALKQLEESEEKYSLLFDGMAEGIVYYKAIYNEKGDIVDFDVIEVNPGYVKVTGFRADQIAGKTLIQLDKEGLVEDGEFWTNIYKQVTETGKPMQFYKRYKNMDRIFLINSFRPKPGTLANIFVDVTESTNLENELIDAKNKFQTISDYANDSILMTDSNGDILYWNKAAEMIFGYELDEILGRNLSKIFEKARYYIGSITDLKDKSGKTFETIAYKKNKKAIYVEFSITSIEIKGDINYVLIARDITERKKLETELENERKNLEKTVRKRTKELNQSLEKLEESNLQLITANKHKDQFLSTMSHELRTPLNAIVGFNELLEKQYFGKLNEKQLEYVKLVEESSRHLLSLINDLLDISRIDTGSVEMELKKTRLLPLVQEVIILLANQYKSKGIDLEYNIDDNIDTICVDIRRFKQILINLLTNAYKFTPSKGKVELTVTKQEENEMFICVKDTGIGISKKDQARIFEEFYQAKHTKIKVIGGTGIGLALTKRLVELHEGTIGVKSKPGQGSEFWIKMPIEKTTLPALV